MHNQDRVCIVQPEHEYCTRSRNARNQLQASNSFFSDPDNENGKGFGRSFQMTHSRFSRRSRRRQLSQLPSDGEFHAQITPNAVSAAAPESVAVHEADDTGDSRTSLPPASQTSFDNDLKTLSSSSESSSESEEETFVDGCSDSKETFVLEIDDETDEDLMSVLLEQELPEVRKYCVL